MGTRYVYDEADDVVSAIHELVDERDRLLEEIAELKERIGDLEAEAAMVGKDSP